MAVVELAQGAPLAAQGRLLRIKHEMQSSQNVKPTGLAIFLAPAKPHPYEAVMVDNLLTICALALDGDDAADYAAAAQEQLMSWTQDALAKDQAFAETKADLPQSALVNYIGGASQLGAVANAAAFSPHTADRPHRSVSFHESSEGAGELRLLALVGESPEVVWTEHAPTSLERELAAAHAVSSGQAALVRDYLPVVETIATPNLAPPAKTRPRLQLFLDTPEPENGLGETAVLLNVRELADWQFKHSSSLTTPPAIVEQAIRELEVPALNVAFHVDEGQTWFYRANRALAFVPTLERGPAFRWALLPLQIQGFTGKLPAGKHTLQIGLSDGSGLLAIKSIDIEIKPGQPTTVTVVAPNEMLYVSANWPRQQR